MCHKDGPSKSECYRIEVTHQTLIYADVNLLGKKPTDYKEKHRSKKAGTEINSHKIRSVFKYRYKKAQRYTYS
jgi:hypothetical protein